MTGTAAPTSSPSPSRTESRRRGAGTVVPTPNPQPLPFLFPRSLVPATYLSPIDHIPPRRDVVRSPVLILEVVGVLPHVEAQQGSLALHERTVLVRRAEHVEPVARQGEPRPAAPEPRAPSGGQLLLEGRDAAERLLDRRGELASRLSAAALAGGGPDRPEQRKGIGARPAFSPA